jgi:hypothetical protein
MRRWRAGSLLHRLTALILALLYLPSCTSWQQQSAPVPEAISKDRSDHVLITTAANGPAIDLYGPTLTGDSLVGWPSSKLVGTPAARMAFPLASIRTVAVRKPNVVGTVLLAGIVALSVVAILKTGESSSSHTALDTIPLGCCPVVYSWDGSTWRLDSGTFAGAFTRGAARTAVEDLKFVRPDSGMLRLKVANALAETDYLDALSVLAVDHDRDMTVAPDGNGQLHTLGALNPPTRATDFRGRDALARVVQLDDWNWESVPTGRDSAKAADIRDGLEVVFPRPRGASTAKLVIDGRNTTWAKYMLDEFVTLHGRSVEAWYDSLDTRPAQMSAVGGMMARVGFLGVSVWAGGKWEPQGFVYGVGPELRKRQVHRLDLARVSGDSVRVRLESAPSFWLIDQVAIDYSADRPVHVTALLPDRATGPGGRDVRAAVASIDAVYFTMAPGDAAEMTFTAPASTPGMARSYLVQATGWYRVMTTSMAMPDIALLRRLIDVPDEASRYAVGRLNQGLRAMAGSNP